LNLLWLITRQFIRWYGVSSAGGTFQPANEAVQAMKVEFSVCIQKIFGNKYSSFVPLLTEQIESKVSNAIWEVVGGGKKVSERKDGVFVVFKPIMSYL